MQASWLPSAVVGAFANDQAFRRIAVRLNDSPVHSTPALVPPSQLPATLWDTALRCTRLDQRHWSYPIAIRVARFRIAVKKLVMLGVAGNQVRAEDV